ncbi:FlgD immunoglobulin-like domain containing protein, partial [candidate division KSB1 bacterium]
AAADGDTASFYRVITNDIEDSLVTGRSFDCVWSTPESRNFKVYSYDDCGNQSMTYAEIDVMVTGVADGNDAKNPTRFSLWQNYPNPFNPVTTIRFELPKLSDVSIRVYDILGREVKTLMSQRMPAGRHGVTWDGTNNFGQMVGSGVYIYRIQAGEFVDIKRMTFIK